MNMRSNVHTHTTWCDGQNTPREMAQAALALGFTDLGFSSHAPAPFDAGCPGVADEAAYRADIAALRAEYAGRLNILCGVEQDIYAPVDAGKYDYVIGSNHYLPHDGQDYVAADGDIEMISVARRWRYEGNGIAMARAFYQLSAKNVALNKPDIVGHFDVITKFNKNNVLFDEEDPAYQKVALEALDEVIDVIQGYNGMFEVNTGAVTRGLRKLPYPAPFLLHHMAQRGARVIITTDCHSTKTLNGGFSIACRQLLQAGYTTMVVLKDSAFQDVKIAL